MKFVAFRKVSTARLLLQSALAVLAIVAAQAGNAKADGKQEKAPTAVKPETPKRLWYDPVENNSKDQSFHVSLEFKRSGAQDKKPVHAKFSLVAIERNWVTLRTHMGALSYSIKVRLTRGTDGKILGEYELRCMKEYDVHPGPNNAHFYRYQDPHIEMSGPLSVHAGQKFEIGGMSAPSDTQAEWSLTVTPLAPPNKANVSHKKDDKGEKGETDEREKPHVTNL